MARSEPALPISLSGVGFRAELALRRGTHFYLPAGERVPGRFSISTADVVRSCLFTTVGS